MSEWSMPPRPFSFFRNVKLLYPADRTKVRNLSTSLSREALTFPAEYEVQWSKNEHFGDSSHAVTTNSNFELTNLENDITYYWRVKEKAAPWGAPPGRVEQVFTFTTMIVPPMPWFTEPLAGAKLVIRPVFK